MIEKFVNFRGRFTGNAPQTKILFKMNSTVCFRTTVVLLIFSSTTFNVFAQQRPKILEHPSDAIATRDEPLTLNCKAAGRPQPEIFWYQNGIPLVPSERRVVLSEGSLFFLRVLQTKREQDAGVYWCEARSSAGITLSNNATLRIAFLKDEFRSKPKNSVALVDGDVLLNCTPPHGLPEPSVLWYKDGKLLDLRSRRQSLIESGSLLISEVQVSDAGLYECSAENMAGRKNTPPALLKVLIPPRIIRGPIDVEVIEGERVDIPCELSGDPKPVTSWYRDTDTLPEGRSRTLLDNTLRIEDVRQNDQGQYVCTGMNEGGNVTLTTTIKVYATPRFIEAPADVRTTEGATLNIPCRADGRPAATVIWDRISTNSTAIIDDEIDKLTDKNLKEINTTMNNAINIRPKRSTGTHYNRMFRSIVLITEEPPAVNMLSKPYFNNPQFEVNVKGELLLRKVRKSDEGWYSCAAINEAGSIVKKIYIHVKLRSSSSADFQIPETNGYRWNNDQNILITNLMPISSSSIDVSWDYTKRNIFSGNIMTLYYRSIPMNVVEGLILAKEYYSVVSHIEKKSHRLKNLKPFTYYEVFASVPKSLSGSISNLRRQKTLDAPPSAPPSDVRVGIINNTAAYVKWLPPPHGFINGVLIGYKIQIKSNTTNKLLGQMSLNASTQSVVINSLTPGGRYTARVAPLTAAGLGPYSLPAALHLDSLLLTRPPKANTTASTWSIWMSGLSFGIFCLCLIGSAIFGVYCIKRNKRNLKASLPTPILSASIDDKSHTFWMQNAKNPTNFTYAISLTQNNTTASEYEEVVPVNMLTNLSKPVPPEPYATVTLQRGTNDFCHLNENIKIREDKQPNQFSPNICESCPESPNSYDYNAKINIALNIPGIMAPSSAQLYSAQNVKNITIRTNPVALSPHIMRRTSPLYNGPTWNNLPPPIPHFPQNWLQERQESTHFHLHPVSNQPTNIQEYVGQNLNHPASVIFSENDYECGSVLYDKLNPKEMLYFNEGGEPTEKYYRNVNMEFFEEQDLEPLTPPPPCPSEPYKDNISLPIIDTVNENKLDKISTKCHTHNSKKVNLDQSLKKNGVLGIGLSMEHIDSLNEGESVYNLWIPQLRRDHSKCISSKTRFQTDH